MRLTRQEAESYRRAWGELPTGWTEEVGIEEERRRVVAAWGARHALCFGSCRHAEAEDRCQ